MSKSTPEIGIDETEEKYYRKKRNLKTYNLVLFNRRKLVQIIRWILFQDSGDSKCQIPQNFYDKRANPNPTIISDSRVPVTALPSRLHSNTREVRGWQERRDVTRHG